MKSLFTIICLLWLSCLTALGQKFTLKATAINYSSVQLSWEITGGTVSRFTIQRSNDLINYTDVATINGSGSNGSYVNTNLTENTAYAYRVVIITASAKFDTNTALVTTPKRLAAPNITSVEPAWKGNSEQISEINVKWDNKATEATGFAIGVSLNGANITYANYAQVKATDNTYTIKGVWPGCGAKIEVRVNAIYENAAASEFFRSNDAVKSIDPTVRKPDVPQNVKASSNPKTDTEPRITVSWEGATNAESVESGFTIEYSKNADFSNAVEAKKTANSSSIDLPEAPNQLIGGQTYYVRVKANNCSGSSGWSNTASATTANGPPPAAPVIASSLSQNWTKNSDKVTVIKAEWTDKSNNETGFDIQWGDNDQYTGGSTSVGANSTYYDIEGSWPGCGHKVYVRVRAKNAGGESAWSPTTVTTSIAKPEAPYNVVATAKSSSEVELKWDGANESYSRESYFVIQYSNNHEPTETTGISVTVVQNTSSTVINVGANTQYYVRIKAENCAGKSEWSVLKPVKTPAGPPATPTDMLAVATSQTVAELSWKYKTLPGFNVTFEVQRSDDGGATFNILPVGTLSFTSNASGEISGKYTNSGLTPSTTYQFRVRAKMPSESGFSNVFTITMPAPAITKPAAPSNLVATAVSSTQIDLTWTDNATNEVGFTVERSTDGTNWTTQGDAGADAKSLSANNLSPNTKYYFRVFARNSAGNSDWSNVAEATTQAPPVTITKPAPPTSLVATATSTSQLNLTWIDASNNEDGFDIERSADNVTWGNSVGVGANTATYAVTGLTASTKYYFRVRSKNSAGPSDWSNVAEATTQAPPVTITKPAAPTNLKATSSNTTQIDLSWVDASNNEDGFEVERSADNVTWGNSANVGANTVNYAATSLTANTKYYFRVRSKNSAGVSEWSNVAEATTQVTSTTTLSAPSNLTVTLVNNTALLVWQDNTSNETGFQVERAVNGASFEKVADLGANIFLHKDENLRAQSTYAYRVRAYRAMTMSEYSNTVEIKFVVTALGPLPTEVRLFPNPATDVLNYTVGSGAYPDMLRIRDVSGRLHREMTPTGRPTIIEVPISQLASGTYYLEVMSNQKPKFFRFIKQ